MGLHTLAWLLWLLAAAFLALANTQPLHSILLIVSAGAVFLAAGRRHPLRTGWRALLGAALWAWGIALAFNLLFSHSGAHVLFELPRNWPLVGGPITLEALLYGLANGASLAAVLLTFAAFNLGVDTYRLLRWLPGGLFHAGMIVSIAVTFVPQLIAGLAAIREAQRIRGYHVRGVRSLGPLVVPLLTTSLERSLVLAESMEARGFAAPADDLRRRSLAPALASVAGLFLLLGGLLAQAFRGPATVASPAAVLMAAGALSLVLSLRAGGGRAPRTHYRREPWTPADTRVAAAALCSLALALWVRVQDPAALWYYPYPPLSLWPAFHPLLGVAAVLVSAPALVLPAPTEARA